MVFNLEDNQKCLIGAIMVKVGQALLLTWGKSNVYYFSYYRNFDPTLSFSYNTLPVALIGIPFAITSVYSIRIAEYFGIERLIRMCAFLQLFALLMAPTAATYGHFIAYYLILVGFGYSLLGFPLLHCLWSHYNKSEGRVTGILFGVFGLATLLFVLTMTYIVNPDNELASETIILGSQEFKYFPFNVAQNVPFAVRILGTIAGLSSAIGSLLVKKRHQSQETIKEIQLQEFDQEDQEALMGVVTHRQSSLFTAPMQLAIRSISFKLLYYGYFSLTLFEITLGLNYKEYGLSKINNDKLLTWIDSLGIILASIANLTWGKLVDKMNFKDLYFRIFIAMGLIGILIPISINISSISFTLVYLSLSVFSKGAIVILGPGLLKIFGNDVGVEIFPLVNTSALIAFIVSPLLQWMFVDKLTFDGIFIIEGVLIILAAILSKNFLILKE